MRGTWLERLRYAFDNYMARGTAALIFGLFAASVVVIVAVSVVVQVAGLAPEEIRQQGFPRMLWNSLLRTLDPGTMGGDEGDLPFLISMLGVTMGGIFIVATLIGVLSTGIEAKLDELRKGRSRVMESGHVVVLGWSQAVYSIVQELVLANANQRRACIVILADRDKVEMEDLIRERVGSTGRTRIVCRTGSPIDLDEIDIASVQTSRAIIVLSPEHDDPDADVIKTLLAITNDPNRRSDPYHVVAEIRDPRNLEVARMVGRDEVELVLVGELIARITAQTCRQAGLSSVYTELLDFGGDEIYFRREDALTGRTFGDALVAYEDSAVIGVRPAGGDPFLNPPMETPLSAGDELILISADDDTIHLRPSDVDIDRTAITPPVAVVPMPERTLLLGWNWRAPLILRELDHYVTPGSEVLVVADQEEAGVHVGLAVPEMRNQKVEFRLADTTDRRVLDSLDVPAFEHVIILCYSDALEAQRADAKTLVTLLHLRDIASRVGHDFSITSEMLDMRNRSLAEVTRADDFIVSGRLISLLMSQVAENKALNKVFTDIFDPDGSEIYLKPAGDYVQLGRAVDFYTVVDAARQRGEVAFGYRTRVAAPGNGSSSNGSGANGSRVHASGADGAAPAGVVVNPVKSRSVTFGADDRIIVLAEG